MRRQRARIRWKDEKLKEAFYTLEKKDPTLFKHINAALDTIEEDAYCATAIPKKLIPKTWKAFSNLWKYDLPGAWRLFYSVAPPEEHGEVTVLAIILDWLDHKDYERKFKY